VASLHSGTETGIKRIVLHRGSAFAKDPPRSSPEAEPRLLKKTQLKENIPSYLQAVGQESNYWPVISAFALTEADYYPKVAKAPPISFRGILGLRYHHRVEHWVLGIWLNDQA
jgi:hypothetical protein